MARTTAVTLLALLAALAIVPSTHGQDLGGAIVGLVGDSPLVKDLVESNFGQAALANVSAIVEVATSPLAEELADYSDDLSEVTVNPAVYALLDAPVSEQPKLVNDVVTVAKTTPVTGDAAQDLANAQNALAVAAGVPTLSPSEALSNRKLLQA